MVSSVQEPMIIKEKKENIFKNPSLGGPCHSVDTSGTHRAPGRGRVQLQPFCLLGFTKAAPPKGRAQQLAAHQTTLLGWGCWPRPGSCHLPAKCCSSYAAEPWVKTMCCCSFQHAAQHCWRTEVPLDLNVWKLDIQTSMNFETRNAPSHYSTWTHVLQHRFQGKYGNTQKWFQLL